jgi:hypothetical protein
MEISIIDNAISKMDHITTVHRNWAVVLWAGSIGLALKQPDLQTYIIFTAAIPLLFWAINVKWYYYISGFVFREKKIAEFLNSDDFQISFQQSKMTNFQVLDPSGKQYKNEDDYKKVVNMRRAFKDKEIQVFYFGMIFLSLLIGIYFLVSK